MTYMFLSAYIICVIGHASRMLCVRHQRECCNFLISSITLITSTTTTTTTTTVHTDGEVLEYKIK